MNDSKISVRYARALFQSALEKNLLEKVNKDMILISEICQIAETKEVISSPVIPPSRKSAIFTNLLTNQVENITLSLINLVIQNGRESHIPGIARVFISDTLKYNGITEAVLTTAVPVEEKVREDIRQMVFSSFGTKADLKEIVDPDIIGGFILRVGDNYIDASIRNKLRKIKKELRSSALAS